MSVDVPRTSEVKPTPSATNHILAIDCSGSMYRDLPKIRTQLKEKLPKLLGEADTISIVWFSGRTQFGTLVKGEPVATLIDLNTLNKAIDRWLKPVLFTGFREPLEEVAKIAAELGGVCSLFFMSDGYDNQWSKSEILAAVKGLEGRVASATFVEYGYYCNHPLMVSMAETAGGQLIFNEDFNSYEPNFEAAMQQQATGGKRVELDLQVDAIRGVAYALDNGSLMTFAVEEGKVTVPEHISTVWAVASGKATGERLRDLASSREDTPVVAAAYAATSLYAQRVDSDIVLALLRELGDVRFIKQFGGCFGKQRYSAFTEATTTAAFSPKDRYLEGYDPTQVPDDDAFTVLDTLRILSEDAGNYLLLDSPDFKYNKIGRSREQKVEYSEEEQIKLDKLRSELEVAPDAKVVGLKRRIAAIEKTKQPLKFKATPMPNGVEIGNLVFNQTQPNVSVHVVRRGTVDIKARKGRDQSDLPHQISTQVHRNYSIIKDGLLNVNHLPVRVSGSTIRKLKEAGLPEEAIQPCEGEDRNAALMRISKASSEREVNIVLDLSILPIINRRMVNAVSAQVAFAQSLDLLKAQAAQKVYNSVLKPLLSTSATSAGLTAIYGEDNAAWLKEQGFTDRGFNPKSIQKDASDYYMAKELKLSLKGLSTLPSLADVQKRVASGKHTASSKLMLPALEKVNEFKASTVYLTAASPEKVFVAWLEGQKTEATEMTRSLMYSASQRLFSIIVGQTWFSEFSSLEEDCLEFEVDKVPYKGTANLREIQIAI